MLALGWRSSSRRKRVHWSGGVFLLLMGGFYYSEKLVDHVRLDVPKLRSCCEEEVEPLGT